MGKKKGFWKSIGALLMPAAVLLLVIWFAGAIANLDSGQSEKGRTQLEDSLRRAAVACYAAEGIYPPDTDYLQEHYGIRVDEEKYAVFYEVFAENLMPDITVLEK